MRRIFLDVGAHMMLNDPATTDRNELFWLGVKNTLNSLQLSPTENYVWEYVAKKVRTALNGWFLECNNLVDLNSFDDAVVSSTGKVKAYSSGNNGEVKQSSGTQLFYPTDDNKILIEPLKFFNTIIDLLTANPRLSQIAAKLASLPLEEVNHTETNTNEFTTNADNKTLYSPVNVPASRLNDRNTQDSTGTSTTTRNYWDGRSAETLLRSAIDSIASPIQDVIRELRTMLVPGQLIHDSYEWQCDNVYNWEIYE